MTTFSDVGTVQCVLIGDRASRRRMMMRKYAKYSEASYDSENGQLITTFNGQKCIFTDAMLNNFVENPHVLLICVSVARQDNVEETAKVILDAVFSRCKNVPFALVGTQIEKRLLRTVDFSGHQDNERYQAMPMHRAESFAKRIGAVKYLECSEMTGEGVEEVFEDAFKIGYHYAREQQQNDSQRKKSPSKSIHKRIKSCIVQ
ncbi:hypothetical protein KIN20_006937 [Parelaphostrongylus tenuis]|uniref:Ras family protein n=1 Tax=Parelaphostrongylus tenuis TaxID=148309 RepID=A0AAD5M4I7_PARTN|nr:hypothetical protein KIN20_006937 [Parelaphostrongylus tenuis]